ncbi:MAG: DUF1016 domain-containing protein, partial [Cytophagales bacterium]|nr:DUF1016 domain-containing protein [Cytophagales bacterium]
MGRELSNNIEKLYNEASQLIEEARNTVYRTANFAMVQAYWNIGKLIVEEEQKGTERADYGMALIEQLSKKLSNHGRGFNQRNLWYMKQFYQQWPNVNALRSELTWTHYRLLLKVESSTARDFYMKESVEGNWSTRQLERQVYSFYYERLASSQDKGLIKGDTQGEDGKMKVSDIIKDPYVLEFLELKDNTNYREHELETALLEKLQDFLLELGKGFTFLGRQHRISTADGNHFYIDLVFYNYILKCFLLIDLKVGKLTPQDVGQMDFYVNYVEDNMKQEGDNPTIGLILCSEKDRAVAKYSLQNKQIFASKYRPYLPTEKQLQEEIKREREIAELEKRL